VAQLCEEDHPDGPHEMPSSPSALGLRVADRRQRAKVASPRADLVLAPLLLVKDAEVTVAAGRPSPSLLSPTYSGVT
jgi:hypothetical protein